MGLRDVRRIWKAWRAWKTVKIQYARERTREKMKPGYQVKKTLWKGGRGLFVALVGSFGLATAAFFSNGPAVTQILLDAGVNPAMAGTLVLLFGACAEMAVNVFKQKA